jgi:nitrite reductase/ring-hydroxylating ferredoxin subunit
VTIVAAGERLCRLEDIEDGNTRGFVLGEGDWPLRGLLVRHGEDVRGFVNHCPHAGHRLNFHPDRFLTPDGQLILCLSHGALFDKQTGACVRGPCVGESLKPVAVVVQQGEVRTATPLDIDALVTRYW